MSDNIKNTSTVPDFKIMKNNPNYIVWSNGDIQNLTTGRILKPIKQNLGYHFSGHFYNAEGKKKLMLTHQIIAQHFLENPNNYTEVNHIDGCKTNNDASNLEYVTRKQNMQSAWDSGLMENTRNFFRSQVGDKSPKSKLTDDNKKFIMNTLRNCLTVKEIAHYYNVSTTCIYSLFNGRTNPQYLN